MSITPKQTTRQLIRQFKAFVRFLKKTTTIKENKKQSLYKLPWCLLFGPKSSGKTSLLLNSDLKFIIEKKISAKDGIPTTQTCDFWVTKNVVTIDSSGNYFALDDNKTIIEWAKFKNHLKNNYYKPLPLCLCLILTMDEVIQASKTDQDNFYQNIKTNIDQLVKQFGKNASLFLIINKCDLIRGFNEFYHDISRDERWQPWGFLTHQEKKKSLESLFNTEFDRLIERLGNQVIWRLQHETHESNRLLINEFPLQMAHTKSYLSKLLENVFGKKNNRTLAGIFFTSATQPLTTGFEKTTSPIIRNPNTVQLLNMKNKSLFAHDFLNKTIIDANDKKTNKLTSFFCVFARTFTYFASFALIITLAFLWGSGFKQQIKTINSAGQSITAYKTINELTIHNHYSLQLQLKSLNTLITAYQTLKQSSSSIIRTWFPNSLSKQLSQKTIIAYKKALATSFYQTIANDLEDTISNKKTPSDLLYASLKSYIMLENNEHYDQTFFKHTMESIWQSRYPAEIQVQLQDHFNSFLLVLKPNLNTNEKLIATTRKRLNKLASIDLAFVILKNYLSENQLLTLNFNSNKKASSVLTLVNTQLTISNIYTKHYYSLIYPKLLEKSAHEAIFGNWILGKRQISKEKESLETKQLTKKFTDQYLSNYANIWIKFLYNIKIINFTNLYDLNQALKILSESRSPLIQLLSLTQSNLVNTVVPYNRDLEKLHALSTNSATQEKQLNTIIAALTNLRDYTSLMASSKNMKQKTFKFTVYRIRNHGFNDPIEQLITLSHLYPDPVQHWLYNLAMNAWQLMLFHSQIFINETWQKNIAQQYYAQIENRFPFAITSTNNVTLNSFNYFFAPNGLINSFFSNYLEPFINTSQKPWHLINLDGETLQIPRTTLQAFQTAQNIRQAYFQNAQQKTQIPFEFKVLTDNGTMDSLTFILGAQKYTFTHEALGSTHNFLWPDATNSNIAEIIYKDKNGKKTTLIKHGPWAMLKLLNEGVLAVSKNGNQFTISLTFDHKPIVIQLSTEQRKNPFCLKTFNNFIFPITLS